MATIKAYILKGPAGSGKTSLAQNIAKRMGAQYLEFLCHPWVTQEDLFRGVDLGKVALKDPAPYRNGILAQAAEMSHKGPVVLTLDELDKAKVFVDNLLLQFLQEGVVEGANGLLKANPNNLVVFMTTNEHRELSDPLLRRAAKLHIPFLPGDVEVKILMGEIEGYYWDTKREFIAKTAMNSLSPVRDPKLARAIQAIASRMRGEGLDISTSELLHFMEFCSVVESREEMEYNIEAWLEKTPDHADFLVNVFQSRKALAGNLWALLRESRG